MTTTQEDINRLLPLVVAGFEEVSGIFLVLKGEDDAWSLALTADWSVICDKGADIPAGFGESSPSATGGLLLGRSLLRIQVDEDLRDPVFCFSDDATVLLRSDLGWESWVMHVRDLPYIVVGT